MRLKDGRVLHQSCSNKAQWTPKPQQWQFTCCAGGVVQLISYQVPKPLKVLCPFCPDKIWQAGWKQVLKLASVFNEGARKLGIECWATNRCKMNYSSKFKVNNSSSRFVHFLHCLNKIILECGFWIQSLLAAGIYVFWSSCLTAVLSWTISEPHCFVGSHF